MAKLKPRARIIRTIGDQLISGPEAALIEMVKNSYDADAKEVNIKIVPCSSEYPTGLIKIEDNGHGMTTNEILTKWFEPATDEKKINKTSRSGERRVLGAKGIGRFASSRLGKSATITSISRLENNKYEKTIIRIDWESFETEKYLEDLEIPIESHLTEETQTGFKIEISAIKIAWTDRIIKTVLNELKKIISPKEVQGNFNIYLDVFSFKKIHGSPFDGKEILLQSIIDSQEDYSDDEKSISLIRPFKTQDNADYILTGSFDNTGNFSGSFRIERGDNINQELNISAPALDIDENSCGPFSIDLKIYDGESESIISLFKRMGIMHKGVMDLKNLLKANAGVSIYRNGFRVRPYGEADVDWLLLEKRRVQDPSRRIGHSQISGKVIIESEENSNLIERSSREGFEHNESFNRLKKLITTVLKIAEEKRLEYREKAGLSRRTKGDVGKAKDIARLGKLIAAAKELPAAYQKTFLDKIEEESKELTKSLEEIENYQKLLESRSALSFVVAQIIHDGRRYLSPMTDAANSLIENNDKLFEVSSIGDVIRKYYPIHARTIKTGAKGLESLFKALDPISGRKRGKPQNFNLLDAVRTAIDFLGDSIIENSIDISIEISEKTTLFGYTGDLQNALLNIIDNAIYWTSTITSERRKISISEIPEKEMTTIRIVNNGPKIEESFMSRLFNPGSTLKTDGHGLGLAIAREACRASKGELYFDQDAELTTFAIQFPNGEK